ncbi:unnamed protein product [Caenorhabditis angaria]|uniref:CYtochrome P450 family n=1 Tax=Caenorhabditis angaria TaxID=860376 RepID=A0A9P1IRK7_9PELO|nr:unnamed protein product [Caenorhabditis angaria]
MLIQIRKLTNMLTQVSKNDPSHFVLIQVLLTFVLKIFVFPVFLLSTERYFTEQIANSLVYTREFQIIVREKLFPAPGYQAFIRWKKRYGPISTFWMGSKKYIIISDYELMKDTFVKDPETYINKYANEIGKELRGGNYGVIETNGDTWRVHRRFALTTLRDLGFGKDLMQMKILIEVEELFKILDKPTELPVDLAKLIDRAVGNVINQMLFGYRFDDSGDFEKLKNLIDTLRETFGEFRYFIQFMAPACSKFIPGTTLNEMVAIRREKLNKFFDAQIKEHRENIDFDSEDVSDYCEGYLKEQKRLEKSGDLEMFNNNQLRVMCLDMWLAGLVTTTVTLTWGISYFLNDSEVRRRIYEELDRVIGSSETLVTTSEKLDLPYMNAFINETQRCANILPINLFHETTRDTVVNGYSIKAGTGIIAQISTVMLDEKVFPNPEKFDPTRFIDGETGKLRKIDEVIPFSIGKRQCLGEGLARMELFLFFANLFNRYEITTTNPPNLDKSHGIIVLAQKINANMQKRS